MRLELLEERSLLAVVSLQPAKDNTLFERPDGSLSNGAGQHFFAGATGQPEARSGRRGLLAFDVAGAVPDGSTINSVTLSLHMSRTTAGAVDVALHRVLADWGEGTSVGAMGEGGGAPATEGDATWLHRFFPGSNWQTPGGDFTQTASGATTVNEIGFYTWASTLQLVADVQQWLDTPGENFGWLLSADELGSTTAKRFDSRENAVQANRPVLTIDFSEPAIVPDVSIADVTAAEGDAGTTDFRFTVTLSEPTTAPVTVDIGTSQGTATANVDFQSLPATTLSFSQGETRQTVVVQVIGDVTVEADETFQVNLSNAVGARVARASATGTIQNDDATSLSISDAEVDEGDEGVTPLEFNVVLSAPSDLPVEVLLSTADESATAGNDYSPRSEVRLVFDPGQISAKFTVDVLGDSRPEADETLLVVLSEAQGATIADVTGVGTIRNDDIPDLTIDDVTLAEGDSGATAFEFVVRLSAAGDLPVRVTVQTEDDTATAGDDYTAVGPIEVQFLPGETVKTVSVPILGDELAEADEAFLVNLRNAVGARIADGTAVGTILDDETTRLFVADVSQTEGDDGTKAFDFVVRLSNPSDTTVTATVNTADGTATAGEDYEPLLGATVALEPGEMETTISVRVFGDQNVEGDETFSVNLTDAVGATLGDSTAIGTILNDDLVAVSIDDALLVEGDAGQRLMPFVVRLSEASPTPVTVQVSTADGTALAGADYVALTGAPLSFAPGETSKTVNVSILGDNIVERDEMLTVRIDSADGADITDGVAEGTIQNDDEATLTIDDVSQAEGNRATTPFVFTVRLSAPSDLPVTVDASTVGGTAAPGIDFVSQQQILTFAPGESLAQQFVVQVIGDFEAENDERFEVELTAATGATIARSSAVGLILDDDLRPARLTGAVYADTNNNGHRDVHEKGIAGVQIELTGVDFEGTPVLLRQTTNVAGLYIFSNLMPGTYTLVETHPSRYLDGADNRGTPNVGPPTGIVGNDRIDRIELRSGVTIAGIHFGERGLRPELIHKSLFHSNTPVPPPVDVIPLTASPAGDWVASLYTDILQRTGNTAEIAWWTDRLDEGISRQNVAAEFLSGDEYRLRMVDAFYRQYLGRAAERAARDYWLEAWDHAGDANAVTAGILASPEYYRLSGDSNAGFVAAVYRDALDREATAADIAYWGDLLTGASRAEVARRILSSNESVLARISGWHLDWLNREPTSAERTQAIARAEGGWSVTMLQTSILVGDDELAQSTR